MKWLLDSVILIDHFNGHSEASDFLASHAADSALSVITRAEVLAGCDAASDALALAVLDALPALPVTAEVADLAGRLRRSARWKLPDALQAAIATVHGLTLVTRNSRDFQPGQQPPVLLPYTLSG